MSYRRPISPRPKDLMKEIMKLVAEPNSKKKLEVAYFQHPGKVMNHDYCDACSGGGEIVCCDRCPRSYHISCHIPTISKLPDGEWFCRSCAFVRNDECSTEVPTNSDISARAMVIRRLKMHLSYCRPARPDSFLEEVPINRKYNVKLPIRKQLDKLKMMRKNDRCTVCKRGVLRGRLVQCHYCCQLYHLNCLDPPIRDWDHNMRWMCPAHPKFYEVAYPEVFEPDSGILTDTMMMKRLRCEPHHLPEIKKVKVPMGVRVEYKEPEENIPVKSTENSSLNILCDVASFALKSMNANHKINSENVSDDISVKFLAHQQLNKFQKNSCLVPKQPPASLFCLTIPINITIQKKVFKIGKSPKNDLCLLPYGSCEFISDYHATITFNDKCGDYLVRNHSRHGILVDDTSYFGRNRPKELKDIELKQINSQIRKYLNKRRRIVRKKDMFHVYQNSGSENVIIKYAAKRQKFNYKPAYKYYMNKLIKNVNVPHRKIQCKCSRRSIPKDDFDGEAVLHNESIVSIGCFKFKFTYSKCTNEVRSVCTEESLAKKDCTVGKKPLNGTRLNPQSIQENSISIMSGTKNKPELVTVNRSCSLEVAENTNSINEQTNISTYDLDNSEDRHRFSNENSNVDGVTADNVIMPYNNDKPLPDDNLSCSASATPSTDNWTNMNGVSGKLQSCNADNDLVQEVIVSSVEEGSEVVEEEIVYEVGYNEASSNEVSYDEVSYNESCDDVTYDEASYDEVSYDEALYDEAGGNDVDNNEVNRNNVVYKEVGSNDAGYSESGCNDVSYEEVGYNEDDNSTVVHKIGDPDLLNKKMDYCNNALEHSVNRQLASDVKSHIPDRNLEPYKTENEHIYCARSPGSHDATIVISDDDEW